MMVESIELNVSLNDEVCQAMSDSLNTTLETLWEQYKNPFEMLVVLASLTSQLALDSKFSKMDFLKLMADLFKEAQEMSEEDNGPAVNVRSGSGELN